MGTDTGVTADNKAVAKEVAVTDAAARAHDIAPPHVQGIEIEVVDPSREVSIEIPRRRAAPRGTTVDLNEFGTTVHNALKSSVTGYTLQVRQNGTLVYNLIWDWAQTPADAAQGWKSDTRMHLASVSKFLTAVGLVHLLKAKNISFDAKIVSYLPAYWTKGPNVDDIAFRHLMTHTSGFVTGGSATDFATMKSKVAAGVAGVGSYDYENMNFGLCRILISVIHGYIAKSYTNGTLTDQTWDLATIAGYRNYMENNVFSPAGVNGAAFTPPPGTTGALAYKFPHQGEDGWDSGNLSTVSGGAGWRLSIKELMQVLDHVRRRNTIVSPSTAQYMLDNRFGIDQIIDTPAGKLYNKNGLWRSNGRTEQCVAYFWPNGMEAALLVNSPIANDGSPRKLVSDSFVASL
jgi:CubicO group peptidase (beta-lactamase class C family)